MVRPQPVFWRRRWRQRFSQSLVFMDAPELGAGVLGTVTPHLGLTATRLEDWKLHRMRDTFAQGGLARKVHVMANKALPHLEPRASFPPIVQQKRLSRRSGNDARVVGYPSLDAMFGASSTSHSGAVQGAGQGTGARTSSHSLAAQGR